VNTAYTIQMASKISGVGVHTIRAWEKRYKALVPHRDSAGHRVYTKTDIEKLMLLSELCLLGFSISKVANLSIDELKAQLADLGKTPESSVGQDFYLVKDKAVLDLSGSRTILLFALKAFKLDVINQELGKIKSLITAKEMAVDLVIPLMNEVRDLSTKGSITSSQEQAALNLLRFHAGLSLYKTSEFSERSSLSIVVSGLDQDANDLFAVVAGLLCNHYGHQLNYLGTSVSVEVLSESLKFLEPELLIVSAAAALKATGQSYMENILEKLQGKGYSGDVLIIGKMDLDRNKFSAKKFTSVQTVEALDEFLSQKRNLNL
jgi:DNA-binding transcriptional MerR regulator